MVVDPSTLAYLTKHVKTALVRLDHRRTILSVVEAGQVSTSAVYQVAEGKGQPRQNLPQTAPLHSGLDVN